MPRMRDQVARRATPPGLCHLHAPPRLQCALPLQRGAHHHQRTPQRLTHEPGPTRRTGRSLHPRTRFIASKIPEARGAGFASNFDLRHHGGHPPALREAGRDPASTRRQGRRSRSSRSTPRRRSSCATRCGLPVSGLLHLRAGDAAGAGFCQGLWWSFRWPSCAGRSWRGSKPGRAAVRRGGEQGFRSLPTGARAALGAYSDTGS